ncbi:MAG: hypothetical protein UR81_C0038G0010 [Candidatus Levybacteria bacterium GW2011_GWB1_35_5]|nr:MAG: hypothetical protein UR81_C0038G0010 [Candidatus Levybacteria bacterium GW2011_GWB1_35_5]
MIRTQVYIPEEAHRKLGRLAEQKAQPMAKIVRDFIEEGLQKTQTGDYSGKKTLLAIVNMKLRGEDTNLSQNIDHYLYGASKYEE